MIKYAILTDTASDITLEAARAHNIDLEPFSFALDGVSATEGVDFTKDEFYKHLNVCKELPLTSMITVLQWLERYEQYDDNGVELLLHVTINSGGSGTYNAAVNAKKTFFEQRPNSKMKIYLVDSHNYSMAYGYFVLAAAKKMANGADIDEILRYLQVSFSSVEIVASMFTLKFVKKSGRVTAAAAFAGELLGLRPIITLIDGVSATPTKVRGNQNVIPALVKHLKEHLVPKQLYLVSYTGDISMGKKLAEQCKKEIGYAPVTIFQLGPAVATNTGPDAIAIVYIGKQRN